MTTGVAGKGSARGPRAAAAAGLAAIALFLILQASPRLNPVTYDESNLVYDASRLRAGQVPYRDFFNFVPPNLFYTFSLAQHLLPARPETACRYAVLAAMMGATLLLYGGLRRVGWGRWESLVLAAATPLGLYPISAFAGHHWLATAALTALAVAAATLPVDGGKGTCLLSGALAALSLGFLQVEGTYACLFVAVLVAARPGPALDRFRRVLAVGAGATLALSAEVGPLVVLGAGGAMWRDLVRWPLSNYTRTGNPNDVGLLADLPDRVAALGQGFGVSAPGGAQAAFGLALLAVVLALAASLLALALWTLARLARQRRVDAWPLAASVVTLASLAVFWRSNATFVHLAYALAPLVGIWALGLGGERGPLRRWTIGLALALVIAGAGQQGARLLGPSPEPLRLADVDALDRNVPLNRFLRAWNYLKPGDRIAVLPTGGNIYLYSYPAAIGYTYFFPLKDRYNDVEDHTVVASQIRRNRPALVVVHRVALRDFLVPEDPVGRVLERDYRPFGETPALAFLVPRDRTGDADASNLQDAVGLLKGAPP